MVIVFIVHLMIIPSLALPFYDRSNPATPSPKSQWQIVSFLGEGGGRGAKLRPLVESHPSSTFDCCLFVDHCFWCNSLAPSTRIPAPRWGCGGGQHCNASPPPDNRHLCRLPHPPAWLLLLLPPALFLSFWAMLVCYVANDQHHWMQGKVSPIRGRRHPHPGAHLPVPPGTWRPTVRWGPQGGSSGQRSWGRGRGRGFHGAAAATIVPGGIGQRHHQPDAGRHGPAPAPVRSMAWQPPVPHERDKGCCHWPSATGPLSRSWLGGASC